MKNKKVIAQLSKESILLTTKTLQKIKGGGFTATDDLSKWRKN